MDLQESELNAESARELTEKIRGTVNALWELLYEAYQRKAWKALEYATWEDYVKQEFDMSRQRSYQLLDQAKTIYALRDASGDLSTKVDITERAARDVKPHLDEVTTEIRDRVEQGDDPAKATEEVVNESRTKHGTTATMDTANKEQDAKPEQDRPKSRGKGLNFAHEAIAVLKRIPNNDGLRDEAFDTVIKWIEDNRS